MPGHRNFRELSEPINSDPERRKRVDELKRESDVLEELLQDFTDVGLIVSRLNKAEESYTISQREDLIEVVVLVEKGYLVMLLFDRDGRLVGVDADRSSIGD